MSRSKELELKLSSIRSRLNALSGKDELSDEERSESDKLQKEHPDVESRYRSALIAEEEEAEKREQEVIVNDPPEHRERVELRSRASLVNYVTSAIRGRAVTGAEAELMAAAGVDGIPLELWDTAPVTEARRAVLRSQYEKRAATPAPATVGVNLDVLQPAVFAPSILPRLGVDMPRVESGTYATGTVTMNQTAGSYAKGVDSVAAAGAFTVQTATPKRISARLELRIEDIAAVGQANFESVLRENLSLALSDELDDQALNGVGGNSGADLIGLFERLTSPTTTPTTAADFDDFVSSFADQVDGLWATRTADVSIVVGPATYQLSAKTFRDIATADLGNTAFSDYAMSMYGAWWTNRRMPAPASNYQQAIVYRSGRMTMPMTMRTACAPHWGYLTIDDLYSGSASGTRFFTSHVLLGDVLLVQPDAYAQVQYRVA